MITVTLYRKDDCAACDQAESDLEMLQSSVPHRLVVIDLEKTPDFSKAYSDQVPVVEAGPYKLRAPFSAQDLQVALGAAHDRHEGREQAGDLAYLNRLERGHTVTKADRISYWLTHHYMLLFNMIVLFYVGIPFLAPVFLRAGLTFPARVIYTIYSPLCHQFAFRSWFLFGEQPAYPRALAEVPNLIPYETATGLRSTDLDEARDFVGNGTLGYKVALCERDVAIYGAILVFGLLFASSGRRIKSIPWYLWVLFGMVPIALDGFSQLPGLANLPLVSWLPIRESTPALRTLTGALFGFTTAWFGYPFVEETMAETRQVLAHKKAVVQGSVDTGITHKGSE